jgi:hypothetical protein
MTKRNAHTYLRRVCIEMYGVAPAWIAGSGNYAVWAECGEPTITLHKTLEEAQREKARLDAGACGSKCRVHRDPDAHSIEDLTDV